MFTFDQTALAVPSVSAAVKELMARGLLTWIRDTVHATHLYAPGLGERFTVHLAFNYDLVAGQEFELIQLTQGKSVQFGPRTNMAMGLPALSHFGYHVQEQEPDKLDALESELRTLVASGLRVTQLSQTLEHTGTQRRYRYAFVDVPVLGAPVKIIQRLHGYAIDNEASVRAGKEQYAWLHLPTA